MTREIQTVRQIVWGAVMALMLMGMVAGCGGTVIVAKEGAGDVELQADRYDCEQAWERTAGAIAFRQDPLGNAYFGFARSGEIQKCLERNGWRVVGK